MCCQTFTPEEVTDIIYIYTLIESTLLKLFDGFILLTIAQFYKWLKSKVLIKLRFCRLVLLFNIIRRVKFCEKDVPASPTATKGWDPDFAKQTDRSCTLCKDSEGVGLQASVVEPYFDTTSEFLDDK